MFISVIVPIFNAEKTIYECLKSIDSKMNNYEVILVDDGSTDNTANIIAEFIKNKNNFIYIYQENNGVSVARNSGIRKSKGDYLLFLDADDYIINFDKILNYDFKGDICIFSYRKRVQNFFNKPKIAKKSNVISLKEFSQNFYYKYDYLLNYVWGRLIKRSIVEENNILFDSNYNFSEDSLFFSEVLKFSNSIKIDNICTINYNNTYSHDKLSTVNPDKIVKNFEVVFKILKNIKVDNKYSARYYFRNFEQYYFVTNTFPRYLEFNSIPRKYLKISKYVSNKNYRALEKYMNNRKIKFDRLLKIKNSVKKVFGIIK